VEKSFEVMRERIVTAHIHDNHGEKDEHLLPHEGTIDWDAALGALAELPQTPDMVLELKEQPGNKPTLDNIREAFDRFEEEFEEKRASSSQA
jgi:sugar phosphate isomerase/epimerase